MTEPDHDKPQADKFRDLARELECDEDEAAFEEKMRKVAHARRVADMPPPVTTNSDDDE